ncbi:MAG: hypothetical protein E5Y58_24200 [Mesorhizobium sp.]|nr:MAG: hypothetical protein E5Y58_24200 [Mesorhizobium sp.]
MSVRPGDDAQAFLAQALAIDPAAETDRIVTALRQQLRGIRKRGLVLGLSGGIDSSVSVALAARAVGPQNVLCLFMPENDSDPESLRLGRLVAGTFGVEAIVEDIGPILRAMGCYQRRDAFIRELVPDYGEGWASKIVIANALEHEGYNVSSLVVQDPKGKQTKIRMPLPVYLGIVAATNKDLRTLINQGLFREDLFYRLNVVPLRLPALRERSEDVPDLVRHFFKLGVSEGLQTKRISTGGIELMKRYPWPGNVRELENLVRRLAALYSQDEISAEVIEAELKTGERPVVPGGGNLIPDDLSIGQAVEHFLQRYFASFAGDLPPAGLYQRILSEVEYPLVLASMTATRGNQIKAAELLGLNRNTLRKKIRELGVNVYKSTRQA